VEHVEDLLGAGDDEHPESDILVSIAVRLEKEGVGASLLAGARNRYSRV
jgi:hypothetical protein